MMRHVFFFLFAAALPLAVLSDDRPLVIVPIDARLELDEQVAYEFGIALRDAPLRWLTPGWLGRDEATYSSLDPRRLHGGRPAVFVHPPYKAGPGFVLQQFTVQLPEEPAAKLRGATATVEEASRGDGVTFRVRADETLLWEQHHTEVSWQGFEVDLAPWAGKTVVLRFETDCGSDDDTSFDWSFWSGRVSELPGHQAPLTALPDPAALDLAGLSSQANDDVAPLSAEEGEHGVTLSAATNEARLRYVGADGELLYCWMPPRNPDDPPLGQWTLHATMMAGQAVKIPLATGNTIEWTRPARLRTSQVKTENQAVRCQTTWRLGDIDATLVTEAHVAGKSLVLEIRCDQPVIARLQAGRWGPVAHQRRLSVPYYPGPIELLPRQNLFVAALVDWTASHASHLIETGAVYEPLTDGSSNLLSERVIFTAAWHVAEVMPNLPQPASLFRDQLGGRVVFDIWGGRYADIAETLATMIRARLAISWPRTSA